MLKKEKSCGCILVHDNKVLLVFEKGRNFWGFPKGHVEKGETEEETALREVKEEVGIDAVIDSSNRMVLHYVFDDRVDKTVVLYEAHPKDDKVVKQESEIEQAKWCTFQEAYDVLTYKNWKQALVKVAKKHHITIEE